MASFVLIRKILSEKRNVSALLRIPETGCYLCFVWLKGEAGFVCPEQEAKSVPVLNKIRYVDPQRNYLPHPTVEYLKVMCGLGLPNLRECHFRVQIFKSYLMSPFHVHQL
jgi:hypothetical protein